MTDDEIRRLLRPKEHPVLKYIGVAIAVGAAVWSASEWLHSRSSTQDVTKVQNDVFQTRLDQETIKGDVKAIHIRVDEGFKRLDEKLDGLAGGKRKR